MKLICTLTPDQRSAQQLEWTDLTPLALSRELIDGGVASTYPLALAEQIEELAVREVGCCGSWLDIAHERHDDHLALTLTTLNADGVAMIRSLSGFKPE